MKGEGSGESLRARQPRPLGNHIFTQSLEKNRFRYETFHDLKMRMNYCFMASKGLRS